MNATLVNNRPKDMSKEEFQRMWENSSHTLEALYKTLQDWVPNEKILPTDFDCPNHYAKLVYQSAERGLLLKILELFPKGLTSK